MTTQEQQFACHLCHNPAMDRHFGFSHLPLGKYDAAKQHYKEVHDLFLPPTGGSYFKTEAAWQEWEQKEALREQERQTLESSTALLDILKEGAKS